MVKDRESCEALPLLDGKTVVIVGPRRLQNALIANYLGTALGLACHVHEVCDTTIPMPPTPGEARLILEDCLRRSAEDLRLTFAGRSHAHPSMTRALFNLRRDAGVERAALQCGVRGFFYEDDAPEAIARGVTVILEGELWVSRSMIAACLRESGGGFQPRGTKPAGLTTREREILCLLALGGTNERIAAQMCISVHTVKTHLYNLYRKINVANRLQAARWLRTSSDATEEGL